MGKDPVEGNAPSLFDRSVECFVILLLLLQVGGIVRSQFVADRFFAWSPHDQRVEFRISAHRNGSLIEPDEILARYGMPAEGRNWHSYGDVLKIIEVVEARRAAEDPWSVRVDYAINLGATQTWILEAPER